MPFLQALLKNRFERFAQSVLQTTGVQYQVNKGPNTNKTASDIITAYSI
jgi:hypothetical protein